MANPLVELDRIGKSYPGVRALDGVTLSLNAGECHALVGENGAGKSTLLGILGGIVPWPEYEGEIRLDGMARRFTRVTDAEAAGIAVVHQELSLVGPLTVAENIALGHEPARAGVIDRRRVRARASEVLARLGASLDPDALVEPLGIGQQQLVEIAKALARDARVLVLDEPTAALTEGDAQALLTILQGLRQRGLAILYVSHRLPEVMRIADRVTVLRDGRAVASGTPATLDERDMVKAMVGRAVDTLFARLERRPGPTRLTVRRLSVSHPAIPGRRLLSDVSFEICHGEILGVAGLMGAGRSTLLLSLCGAAPGPVTGELLVNTTPVHLRSPRDALANGIALLTEDRKRLGLLLDESVTTNITLATLRHFATHGLTREAAERGAAEASVRDLRIRAASTRVAVGTLSGGNQQKVLAARSLLTRPGVLLLDEPTRGIDIGTREEIYALIHRLAADGLAVLLVSSDLTEVLGLSDRVLVLREGRIVATFGRNARPEAVMAAATMGRSDGQRSS